MPTPLSYLHPKPAVGQVNEIGGFQVGKWKKNRPGRFFLAQLHIPIGVGEEHVPRLILAIGKLLIQ